MPALSLSLCQEGVLHIQGVVFSFIQQAEAVRWHNRGVPVVRLDPGWTLKSGHPRPN